MAEFAIYGFAAPVEAKEIGVSKGIGGDNGPVRGPRIGPCQGNWGLGSRNRMQCFAACQRTIFNVTEFWSLWHLRAAHPYKNVKQIHLDLAQPETL